MQAVSVTDDVQLCHALELADGDIARAFAGILTCGLFKNRVFKFAHRIVGKRFYLCCRREQLFKIACKIAYDERR